jgi:hypothetical protein
MTAEFVREDLNTNTHTLSQTVSYISGTPYTLSAYFKASVGTRSGRLVFPTAAFTTVRNGFFDLQSGAVISNTAGTTASITPVGNGWYRCSLTSTATATTSGGAFAGLGDGSTAIYTGDGTSGIFIWGAQLSDSASLDPYVYNPGAAPASTAYFGPRFDYDPVTLAPKGLLIEEQRTNLVLQSEAFNDAGWSKTGSTITANTIAAPDGALTSDKLVEDTSNGFHSVGRNETVVSGVTYALSIYLKAGERTEVSVLGRFSGSWVVRPSAIVNLASGTISSSTGAAPATITAVGNGWYRVTIVGTTNTTSAGFQVDIRSGGTQSYTGDGTSGLYIWGAQIEAGAFATSYIPTTTATATRAADVAVMTGANFSNWYNQSEGSLFAEAQATWTLPVNGVLTSTHDGTTSNRIRTFLRSTITSPANRLSVYVSNAGSVTANIGDLGLPASQAISKICYAYQGTALVGTKDGAAVSTGTSGVIPVLTQLSIGTEAGGSSAICGHIRRLAFFPRRLADAELTALTS